MRDMTIALGLVERGDSYLLQLRPQNRRIGAAGLIGCFGGKIEQGETPQHAAWRELAEETTINVSEQDYVELGEVNVISDNNFQTIKVKGHLYKVTIDPSISIEAKPGHGEVVSIQKDDIPARLDEMTPGTRASFEQYVLGEQ